MSFFSFSPDGGRTWQGAGPGWAHTGYYAPPPPPPPVEITFEYAGRHRLLVEPELLRRMLAASAEYEQHLRDEQAPAAGPDLAAAEHTIRAVVFASMPEITDWKRAVRRAKRLTHPDHGGTNDAFRRVTDAEAVLRRHGLIP